MASTLVTMDRLRRGCLSTHSRLPHVTVCVLLIIGTAITYREVPTFGFVNYDDPVYITDNPIVLDGLSGAGVLKAFQNTEAGYWRPLSTISFMLEKSLFDLSPGVSHIVNLGIHCTNAVLLFHFLLSLTSNIWPAALVAGLFALHPTNVETVCWASERKGLLGCMFFLLVLITFLQYRRSGKRAHLVISCCLFTLGLMSKPTIVIIPVILILLDYLPLSRFTKSSVPAFTVESLLVKVRETMPFFLLAIAATVFTVAAEAKAHNVETSHMSFLYRLEGVSASYFQYVQALILPVNLCVFYPLPTSWSQSDVWGFLALTGMFLGLCLTPGRDSVIFGICWFVATSLPTINLLQFGDQSHADRYAYISFIGLFIAIVWQIVNRFNGRFIAIQIGVALLLLCCLSWLTTRQARTWRTSTLLFEHALECTTGNFIALNNLAWEIASKPGHTDLDSVRALDYSASACAITKANNYDIVDTFAMCCNKVLALKIGSQLIATATIKAFPNGLPVKTQQYLESRRAFYAQPDNALH